MQPAGSDRKNLQSVPNEISGSNQEENIRPILLHVADDPLLLASRGILLASRWRVVSTHSGNACATFEQRAFDLVLICHSVSLSRRGRLVNDICSMSQSVPILIVSSGGPLSATPPAIITAQEPDVLLTMIGHYLRQHQPPFGPHE